MKENLYQLTNDVENLYQQLVQSVDIETGEIDGEIAQALAVKEEAFNEKSIAIATICRRFETQEDLIDGEIKRLTALKDRARKIQDKLKSALTTACQRLCKTEINGISANISFRTSEKTIVDNEELVPEEYFNVVMTKKPNLTKIKTDLKSGKEIAGVHIQQCSNIQIK